MKLKNLSAHDAVTVLEIIHESLSIRSEGHIRPLLLQLRELLPYQAGIAAMAHIDGKGNPGELTLVNVDYPEEYLQELWRTGLVWRDPILVENFRNYSLQYWGDTFLQHPLLKANRNLAEDFGFYLGVQGHGYGHGVKNKKGKVGSFFCWHGLDRDPRTEEVISLVVPHLHEAMLHAAEDKHQPSKLTPREREVLKWLAHGKTTWDIAVILNISERTVKFHIANISRKLDVTTRAHAVAKALRKGLIDLD